MSTIGSSLSKGDDGTALINPSVLHQISGIAKDFMRAAFDAAVAQERTNITNNGRGIWNNGEKISIFGETGTRIWFVGASANLSHARNVLYMGKTYTLATDVNVFGVTSGAPASIVGANGDMLVDATAGLVYGPKTAGSWPSGSALTVNVKIGDLLPLTSLTAAPVRIEVFDGSPTGKFIELDPACFTISPAGLLSPKAVAPAVLSNMQVLTIANAGSSTITLPKPATPGNYVLLMQSGYCDTDPANAPAIPAGFARIGNAHFSDNEDLTVFFGPVSALVNNGVAFTTQLGLGGSYGGIILLETSYTKATATAMANVPGDSGSFSVNVPSQSASSLLLGLFSIYDTQPNATLSATQGSILYQNNSGGHNHLLALFTQVSSTTPVQFTENAGGNCQDLMGLGLELTA